MKGGEFEFGLFDSNGDMVAITNNSASGKVAFRYDVAPGDYTIREISSANEDIITDAAEYQITITEGSELDELGNPEKIVTYSNGIPKFKNAQEREGCGLIEFPDLIFTEPGLYEYTIREISDDAYGWLTDDKRYRVDIIVEEDADGNLSAFARYPDGYPEFVDVFTGGIANFIVSACKIAVGAPLPEGKFEFELLDENDVVLATATNSSADETILRGGEAILSGLRTRNGSSQGGGVSVGEAKPHRSANVSRNSGAGICEMSARAVMRRYNELVGTTIE